MSWPHPCRHGVTAKLLAYGPSPQEAFTYLWTSRAWGEVEEGASGESAFTCDGLTLQGAGTEFTAEPLDF